MMPIARQRGYAAQLWKHKRRFEPNDVKIDIMSMEVAAATA